MDVINPPIECRLINASIAAYYIIQGGGFGPGAQPYLSQIGIKQGTTPTSFTNGPDKVEINAGFVAETQDDWVFLAFRGTIPTYKGDFWRWIFDWLNDFRIGPMEWNVDNKVFGQVETGFAYALLDLWPQVLAALQRIDLSAMKGIIVTGHSKGAAMSFLAASLLRGQYYKNTLVSVCCFAAPRATDRTFQNNYDALNLRPLSVRYQNEYDIVPYLPWVPALDALAAAERRSSPTRTNALITEDVRQQAIKNDYVPLGMIAYITTTCGIEHGEQAEKDGWAALLQALHSGHLDWIVEAHAARGRYLTCICPE
jgi:Lipase (class 3)